AGKEEIVGLLTALRLYVKRDHAAEVARCTAQVNTIVNALTVIPHVTAEVIPQSETGNAFPLARIRIDQAALNMTGNDFILALKQGNPSIHPLERELEQGAVVIHPFGLQPGDDELIVERVQQIIGVSR
ncbi:MAG: hypothetical protein KDE53_05180, partial [Caldilineaceae bacterium]|nr:hypothetical protein [Caldilineaceae bacterium]